MSARKKIPGQGRKTPGVGKLSPQAALTLMTVRDGGVNRVIPMNKDEAEKLVTKGLLTKREDGGYQLTDDGTEILNRFLEC